MYLNNFKHCVLYVTKASVFNFKLDSNTFPPNMPTFKFSKSKSSMYLPKYLFSNDATIPSNIVVEDRCDFINVFFAFPCRYIVFQMITRVRKSSVWNLWLGACGEPWRGALQVRTLLIRSNTWERPRWRHTESMCLI